MEGEGWIRIADLLPGHQLSDFEGQSLTVTAVQPLGYTQDTYNFTVADFHSYFAGDAAVLVHNCECALADGKVRFKRWKNGDAIDKPMPDGSAPSWDVVRSRYWKSRAASSEGEFSAENLRRMREGSAPLDYNPRTGNFESRELHHVVAQRDGGSNSPLNLRELTPDQHGAVDPYRHTVPTTTGIR